MSPSLEEIKNHNKVCLIDEVGKEASETMFVEIDLTVSSSETVVRRQKHIDQIHEQKNQP